MKRVIALAILVPTLALSQGRIPTGHEQHEEPAHPERELYTQEHSWFPKEMGAPDISPERVVMLDNPTQQNVEKALAMEWFRIARREKAIRMYTKERTEAMYEVVQAWRTANPGKKLTREALIVGMVTRYKTLYHEDIKVMLPTKEDLVDPKKLAIVAEEEAATSLGVEAMQIYRNAVEVTQ